MYMTMRVNELFMSIYVAMVLNCCVVKGEERRETK